MCTQKPPHDYSQQLYDKYRESFEEYIVSTVSDTLIWFLGHGLAFWCIIWLLCVLVYNFNTIRRECHIYSCLLFGSDIGIGCINTTILFRYIYGTSMLLFSFFFENLLSSSYISCGRPKFFETSIKCGLITDWIMFWNILSQTQPANCRNIGRVMIEPWLDDKSLLLQPHRPCIQFLVVKDVRCRQSKHRSVIVVRQRYPAQKRLLSWSSFVRMFYRYGVQWKGNNKIGVERLEWKRRWLCHVYLFNIGRKLKVRAWNLKILTSVLRSSQ